MLVIILPLLGGAGTAWKYSKHNFFYFGLE